MFSFLSLISLGAMGMSRLSREEVWAEFSFLGNYYLIRSQTLQVLAIPSHCQKKKSLLKEVDVPHRNLSSS